MNWICRPRHWPKIAVFLLLNLSPPTAYDAAAADPTADDISDIPMEVRQKTAPANVMFIIDNSGSMDAEFATDEPYGYFGGNWYPFQLATAAAQSLWRARWHGANRMYYDPNRQYGKWPDFDAAAHDQEDMSMARMPMVRQDPRDAGATFDLSLPFHTAAPAPVGLPAIPRAHYYLWHDANKNGVADDKEIWLVTLNFASGGWVERHYYNFDLGANGLADPIPAARLIAAGGVPADMRQVAIGDNELAEVAEAAVPAEVKARWTRTDGTRYAPSPQEELLNFAAWYTYHRKRSFAAIGAVSAAIGRLSGVQVGLYTMNGLGDGSGVTSEARTGVRPVKAALPGGGIGDDTQALRTLLYGLKMPSGPPTPLNTAFLNVAKYFDTTASDGFKPAGQPEHPWASAEDGGACQQAFFIVISDGEYSDAASVANVQGDGPFGPPYHDDLANTFADLVMRYWNADLAPRLDNNVPVSAKDGNNRQHIATYTIGFGIQGAIAGNDMNKNGIPDEIEQPGCSYAENPYFKKPGCAIMPAWPSDMDIANAKVDDLWHAAVNGHGQYFSAAKPEELIDALSFIAADIGSRQAIGASAAINSSQLNDNTVVYVGRYDSQEWTGDLLAYKLKRALNGKITGKVDVDNPVWSAAAKLKANTGRVIFTSNGDGQWLDFTPDGLSGLSFSAGQRQMLTIPGGLTLADSVAYIRGKNGIAGTRQRGGPSGGDTILGDIIHSTPVLARAAGANSGGVIFVGAGDGMLHAFDAETGAERFAFIPSLLHDHLVDLSKLDYLDAHRYYVDASPVVGRLAFFDGGGRRTKDMRLLVSGLGRGGKGYFALDVSNADAVGSAADTAAMLKWEYPGRAMSVTGLDVNGDGRVESNTPAIGNPMSYTYQYEANSGAGGAGLGYGGNAKSLFIYDGGARIGLAYRDDDLGYSYSAPVIVRSYLSANQAMPTGDNDHPWVVIFGNGYDSRNGKAILYVLDALTGQLIRKIDTGVGGEANRPKNGLSSPAVVDVDDDKQADFAYAGDLRGNLWKFDLRAADPGKWCVAHENSGGQPQPLFTTAASPGETGQPITTMPQVLHHNKKPGYMVVFGSGKFLNETDRADQRAQTLFGIWDNDAVPKGAPLGRGKYLGVWNRDANRFSNQTTAHLLKQEVLLQQTMSMKNPDTGETNNVTVRVTSNNSRAASGWWSADNPNGYMGWYLDLPGRDNIGAVGGGAAAASAMFSADAAERVVKDPLIRDGKVIAVSFIPSGAPCGAGGYSFLMELSAFTGDRPSTAQLDIDGDGKLTAADLITITGGNGGSGSSGNNNNNNNSSGAGGGGKYPASGYGMDGMINMPVFTGGSDEGGEAEKTEMKILPGSSGVINTIAERASEVGIYYWREMSDD